MRPLSAVATVLALCSLAVLGIVLLLGPGVQPGDPMGDDPGTTGSTAGEYPPGVNEAGHVNASQLLDAHRRSLVGAGYVVTIEYTNRTVGPGTNYSIERRIAATGGQETVWDRRTRRTRVGRRTVAFWANDSVTLERITWNGRATAVTRSEYVPDVGTISGTDLIARVLRRGDFAVVAENEVGGTTTYTLRAKDGVSEGPRGTTSDGRLVSTRLVVDRRGVVRTLQASIVRPGPNATGRTGNLTVITYRTVETDVETISPPPWVRAVGSEDEP